jgi:hypothetical protein
MELMFDSLFVLVVFLFVPLVASQLAIAQHTALMTLYKSLKCDGTVSCPSFDASAACPSDSALSLTCQGGNVTSIYVADVSQASATISSAIGSLTALSSLTLYGAALEGSMPTQIGQLTNLVSLVVQGTSLQSSLPTQIGRLTKLTKLAVRESRVNATIPSQIGNLKKLKQLWLNSNRLEGLVPSELALISTITQVQLEQNRLTGPVLPWISVEWPALQTLDIAENDFTGELPDMNLFPLLGVLHVNRNRLSGLLTAPAGLFECLAIDTSDKEQNCFSQCAKICCPTTRCATDTTATTTTAPSSSRLSTTRVPDPVTTSRTSGGKKPNNNVPIGIGIGVGIIVFMCVGVVVFLKCCGKKFQARNSRATGGEMADAFLADDERASS